MSFVQVTDFDNKPYNLPNIAEDDSFQSFVDRGEEKILRRIVGHTMYDLIMQAVEYPGAEPKYDDFINGVYYNLPGSTIKRQWKGVRKMLIPYIYCIWTQATFDNHGLNGVEVAKVENANLIGPNDRMVRSYNDFADMVGSRKTHTGKIDSMYGFLYSRAAEFTDYVYCGVGRMNILGLRSGDDE